MSFRNAGIELSDGARDDLAEIVAHGIAEWGELQSGRYYSDLLRTIELIGQYPLIGEGWNEADGRLRRWVFRSHVIFYRVNEPGQATEVVRILHARMDANRHLDLS